MNLASISENKYIEKRIAITPEITKKYISLGFNLFLPNNYGSHLGFSDDQYKILGANFVENEEEIIKNSDVIIQLGLFDDVKLSLLKENQTLIGSLNVFSNKNIAIKIRTMITMTVPHKTNFVKLFQVSLWLSLSIRLLLSCFKFWVNFIYNIDSSPSFY